jgi:DNA-3-methyladenine glycosylase II
MRPTPRSRACMGSGHGPPIFIFSFALDADAFPSGDLAVQESARLALGLRKRPDAKALTKIAEAWRPWRGVAAHLLWAYYHVVKKRDVVPVQPNGRPNEAAGAKTAKRKKKNG